MDRRVKAVLSQIPLVNLIRPDIQPTLNAMFQHDRLACMASKEHGKTPVVHEGPLVLSSSEPTIRSLYPIAFHRHRYMTVARDDVLTPPDLALETYSMAREPKEVHIVPGRHSDGYAGFKFERKAGRQTESSKQTLCS
ncbi:hypothetical protein LTR56_028230 [Elasticomyces elasticus]|nr:hypothetical protein LTR56_028230 [Elasticomyces elasticus]KAK4894802.1 hypothetical protein LTR49_028341 [Elasticomyces elasticus]